MADDVVSADLGPRARRLVLWTIAIAFAVDAACLLIALTWSAAGSAAGPWQGAESALQYPGLIASDAALAAILLLALLALTLGVGRWPRLVAGTWALTGLTALVASTMSAWVLVSARGDGAAGRAVLDTAGDWLAVSQARLLVLSLLLVAQCVTAVLLLLAARAAIGRGSAGFILRCLLALPLAVGIYHGVLGVAWSLAIQRQDALYYLANTAIVLAPAIAYAAAGMLLLTGQRNRTAWLILLACGAALSLLYMGAWWQYGYWPDLIVASLSLTVLSGALLLRPSGLRQPVVR